MVGWSTSTGVAVGKGVGEGTGVGEGMGVGVGGGVGEGSGVGVESGVGEGVGDGGGVNVGAEEGVGVRAAARTTGVRVWLGVGLGVCEVGVCVKASAAALVGKKGAVACALVGVGVGANGAKRTGKAI